MALRVVALLLLALPAAAQFSEKTVVKLVKSENKLTLKQLKAELDASLSLLEAGFDAAEDAAQDADLDGSEAQAWIAALSEFQQAVRAARDDADQELAQDAAAALDLLSTGESLLGLYPGGFYAGDDGLYDDARAGVDKLLAKLYAKANKRGDKVVKTLAKEGFELTVQLLPPRRALFGTPHEDATTAGEGLPTDVEVMLGLSLTGASDDGRILVAGVSDPAFGDVEVLASGVDGALLPAAFSTEATPDANGSWTAILDGAGLGLPEGNWLVELDLDPGIEIGAGTVGVP